MQVTVWGLAGFPTRRKVTTFEVQDTLVGTRFFSAGIGSEIAYNFINSLKRSLAIIFQNRLIHFFTRSWFPILPENAHIKPGNVWDLLLSMQYRERKNLFEVGYNPTFFTNQAIILERRQIDAKSFVRHSFYSTYSHLFRKLPLIKTPGIVGSGFSIGRAKRFNTKIFSWWAYISMAF